MHCHVLENASNCILLLLYSSRADQIVSVNGKSLLHASVDEAMLLLSPKELLNNNTLQVIRPKKVDALIKLLADDQDTDGPYASNW